MDINPILSELKESAAILDEFIHSNAALSAIENSIVLMSNGLLNGNKIISCGNGGSMSDAMHFAEELSGKFRNERKPLPAIAIADPAYITCTGNDYGFDHIFARFIEGFGKEGDILLAISTSGNSPNVIKAAQAAKQLKMSVVALTGKDGGALSSIADIEIRAPYSNYSDRAQEIHIKVIHILIKQIEEALLKAGAL
ncbi:MAG: SIS domain-containing protein [Bacteroidota bacterium]|jgi:D-sedoheptulose 7-phosphate isomerase